MTDTRKLKVIESTKRLLSSSILSYEKGKLKDTISIPILGALTLASLTRHVATGHVAPAGNESLHGLLVPFLKHFAVDDNARACVNAYKEIIKKDRRHVEGLVFEEYVAKVIQLPVGKCLSSLFKNHLLPAAMIPSPASVPTQVLYRRIHAEINTLKCFKAEELGSDEVYILTGGTIFDSTGIWSQETNNSKVYDGINGSNSVVPLTRIEAAVLNQKARNGPDGKDSPSAMCTVTLIEHEYGDIEKIRAALDAAYTAGRMIAAVAAATGPVGIAVAVGIALPSLLQSLAILLDGEDELGTVAFRFDHFLDGPVWALSLSERILGEHLFNNYSYMLLLNAGTQDELGPLPEISIMGKSTVSSSGTTGNASYKINYCVTSLTGIKWSVAWADVGQADISPAITSGQGQREIVVKFGCPGRYTVSVAAEDAADGRTLSASLPVSFHSIVTEGGTAGGLNDAGIYINAA